MEHGSNGRDVGSKECDADARASAWNGVEGSFHGTGNFGPEGSRSGPTRRRRREDRSEGKMLGWGRVGPRFCWKCCRLSS